MELGTQALTAVSVSALKLGKKLQEAAADGIQYSDAFVLVAAFPQVQSIAANARQALAELKDLTPAEALKFSADVASQAGLPADSSTFGKIRQSLALAAETYEFTVRTYDKGASLVHRWGDVFDIHALRGDGKEA